MLPDSYCRVQGAATSTGKWPSGYGQCLTLLLKVISWNAWSFSPPPTGLFHFFVFMHSSDLIIFIQNLLCILRLVHHILETTPILFWYQRNFLCNLLSCRMNPIECMSLLDYWYQAGKCSLRENSKNKKGQNPNIYKSFWSTTHLVIW